MASEVFVDLIQCDDPNGGLFIEININGHLYERIGGFKSREERQRALDDIGRAIREHARPTTDASQREAG